MAEHELCLPKLGMQMVDATIVEWVVEDGAQVEAGQEVVTISTDKVDTGLEAPVAGTIHIRVQADEIANVGDVLAVIS